MEGSFCSSWYHVWHWKARKRVLLEQLLKPSCIALCQLFCYVQQSFWFWCEIKGVHRCHYFEYHNYKEALVTRDWPDSEPETKIVYKRNWFVWQEWWNLYSSANNTKIVNGGDININNFIGDHECSNMPPSLFTENRNSMIADAAMVLRLK